MARVVVEGALSGGIKRPWLGADGQAVTAELAVDRGRAPEVVERALVAEHLLDRAGDQRRVRAQIRLRHGMLEQEAHPGGEQVARRVVAGGGELHEEPTELRVGHGRAAKNNAERHGRRGQIADRTGREARTLERGNSNRGLER